METRLTNLKDMIVQKMREKLNGAKSVMCTTDCWSSLAQGLYITVTAYIINSKWNTQSFALSMCEMKERHAAKNFVNELK